MEPEQNKLISPVDAIREQAEKIFVKRETNRVLLIKGDITNEEVNEIEKHFKDMGTTTLIIYLREWLDETLSGEKIKEALNRMGEVGVAGASAGVRFKEALDKISRSRKLGVDDLATTKFLKFKEPKQKYTCSGKRKNW